MTNFRNLTLRSLSFLAPVVMVAMGTIFEAPVIEMLGALALYSFFLLLLLFRKKREKNLKRAIINSLLLGLGIALILIPEYPGVKFIPFALWTAVLFTAGYGQMMKRIREKKEFSSLEFIKLAVLTIPVLGVFYTFGSQYIWLMSVAFILILASQQKDTRSNLSTRFKLYQASALAIVVGAISTAYQFFSKIDLFSYISAGAALTILITLSLIVIIAVALIIINKREELEAKKRQVALLEKESQEKMLKWKRHTQSIEEIIHTENIQYEYFFLVSNAKQQIVFGVSALDLLAKLEFIMRNSYRDNEIYKATLHLEGIINYVRKQKDYEHIIYKGEEALFSKISNILEIIPQARPEKN